MAYKRIKIKIGQTNKQPISTVQLVALNIHTKQQKLNIRNDQMEESNMNANTESNKKRTWTVLAAIAWLPAIVLLQNPSNAMNYQLSLFPLKNIFFAFFECTCLCQTIKTKIKRINKVKELAILQHIKE